MNLENLETPCLIVDRKKLKSNLFYLHERMQQFGVNLRPHGKTAKNIDIISLAMKGVYHGITVSTLKEAEYYFEHGINDIVYAVGIAPVKLDRLMRLILRGAKITIILDSLEQVHFVSHKARESNQTLPVLIELDCDGHRSGITSNDSLLLEIGQLLQQQAGVSLNGVLTHAGNSYQCHTTEAIVACAEREREIAVKCAEILRHNGLFCPIVSIGSTPTAHYVQDLAGITEFRAGVYMFYDLVMAKLKVCTIDQIALTVLTTIIGRQINKGRLITDAGWMALSNERDSAAPNISFGYGLVCDINGTPIPELMVSAANQEHGIITAREGMNIDWEKFRIGQPLRILPNHACATAAMHDHYNITDDNREIVASWLRINGW